MKGVSMDCEPAPDRARPGGDEARGSPLLIHSYYALHLTHRSDPFSALLQPTCPCCWLSLQSSIICYLGGFRSLLS